MPQLSAPVIAVLALGSFVAGLLLYMLWPDKPPLPPEEAINESIVAQQWAGGLDHAGPPALPPHPPFG